MKTIGLIGGLSWESTAEYYRIINQEVRQRLGGLHSAKIIMYSFDFAEIEILQRQNRMSEIKAKLDLAGETLVRNGAEVIVLCSNTAHLLCEELEKLPAHFLHIADAVGEIIKSQDFRRVALLGTKITMQSGLYRDRLSEALDIDVLLPSVEQMDTIDNIVLNELCLGQKNDASKNQLLRILEELTAKGAQGLVLGCTELPLLITQNDCRVPLFDSTLIHSKKAVECALV